MILGSARVHPTMAGATRLAPYLFPLLIVAYWPLLLVADAHVSQNEQYLLGLATLALLVAATRGSSATERRQVWLLVLVATAAEVLLSVVWGVYRYRYGNVPLFVPFGHGLVFLFALRTARTPFVRSRERLFVRAALTCGGAWLLVGLTVLPFATGRIDLLALVVLPVFIWVLRRPSAAMCAGAFFVIAELELLGTALGSWTWSEVVPGTWVHAGNPPALAAAGYCLIELSALRAAPLLSGLGSRMPVPRPLHTSARALAFRAP